MRMENDAVRIISQELRNFSPLWVEEEESMYLYLEGINAVIRLSVDIEEVL